MVGWERKTNRETQGHRYTVEHKKLDGSDTCKDYNGGKCSRQCCVEIEQVKEGKKMAGADAEGFIL